MKISLGIFVFPHGLVHGILAIAPDLGALEEKEGNN
jgi:hypothetical protein